MLQAACGVTYRKSTNNGLSPLSYTQNTDFLVLWPLHQPSPRHGDMPNSPGLSLTSLHDAARKGDTLSLHRLIATIDPSAADKVAAVLLERDRHNKSVSRKGNAAAAAVGKYPTGKVVRTVLVWSIGALTGALGLYVYTPSMTCRYCQQGILQIAPRQPEGATRPFAVHFTFGHVFVSLSFIQHTYTTVKFVHS